MAGFFASGPGPGEMTRTFYLENADVKDVVTILRSVAAIPRRAADEGLAAIDVRGSADAVELRPAESSRERERLYTYGP